MTYGMIGRPSPNQSPLRAAPAPTLNFETSRATIRSGLRHRDRPPGARPSGSQPLRRRTIGHQLSSIKHRSSGTSLGRAWKIASLHQRFFFKKTAIRPEAACNGL